MVQPKGKERPDSVSVLPPLSPQSLMWVFPPRKICTSKGSRGCCEPLPKEHFGVGLQFQGVAVDFPLVAQRGTQNDWSSSPHIIFRTDMGRVRIDRKSVV